MFLRFVTSSTEIFINLADIESFGKFERDNLCVPQAVPSGQGQFKFTLAAPSLTPAWEYWIQLKGYIGNEGRGRLTCTEQEYQQVVELLAPGGAELYDELRQSRNNANPNSGRNNGVAKLAVPSGETEAKDTSASI